MVLPDDADMLYIAEEGVSSLGILLTSDVVESTSAGTLVSV
jgi:hypothetical protein